MFFSGSSNYKPSQEPILKTGLHTFSGIRQSSLSLTQNQYPPLEGGFKREMQMSAKQEEENDIVNALKLKDQPTWQLALELSALKKKLAYIENELNVLGQDNKESSGRAQREREVILEKIHALEEQLEERKSGTLRPINA